MTNGAGPASGYPSEDDCRLADLIDLVSEKTDVADYPCASAVEQNVLIYDGARLRQELSRPAGRPRVETELARALRKGDAVFFNPALFHAAGTNRTADVNRMANLLQVSSAFGRAMEAVDRSAMSAVVFPALRAMADAGAPPSMIASVIAACAEGYSFPTNLDLDQPIGGLAPATQAEILHAAVADGWSRQRLETELGAWSARRQTQPALGWPTQKQPTATEATS
jgi:hypothetical protein